MTSSVFAGLLKYQFAMHVHYTLEIAKLFDLSRFKEEKWRILIGEMT